MLNLAIRLRQLSRRIRTQQSWIYKLVLGMILVSLIGVIWLQGMIPATAQPDEDLVHSSVESTLQQTDPPASSKREDSRKIQQFRDRFRQAYDHRYVLNRSFPGYQAEVSLNYEQQAYHGLVRVSPNAEVSVINIIEEPVRNLVMAELEAELNEHQPGSFDSIAADITVRGVSSDVSSTQNADFQIQVTQAGVDKVYQVQANRITQIKTVAPDQTVIMTRSAWIQPPEGPIPIVVEHTIYDTATGELIEHKEIRDDYNKIGPYYLLARRDIRYGEARGAKQKPIADVSMIFNDFLPLRSN